MNALKSQLLSGEPSIGTWIQIGNAAIAEILGDMEFDWIAVDCEHTDISVADFATVIRGLYGRRPVPLARVRENDTLAIRQALDVGAQGVIVPLINTPQDAERAVAAARFPPDGLRGFAYFRSNAYGSRFDEYVEHANGETIVVAMIETKSGVESIEQIVAVEGLDGVFVGPYDLSGSYGVPGQTGHARVVEAQQRIVCACQAAGKSAGLHIVHPSPEAIGDALERGFTFIALGMDTVFLQTGARESLGAIEAVLGTTPAPASRGSSSPHRTVS